MEDPREFWEQRYRAGRLAWDHGKVPQAFAAYLSRSAGNGRRAYVPGCGSGYEIAALDASGWDVLGLDFSEAAVARGREVLGPRLASKVMCADFFKEPAAASFDLVYERTFLCALPPDVWDSYSRRMGELVRPGGVLCGFFFFGPEDEPPPFPISSEHLTRLLGPHFELIEDAPVMDSLPLYQDKERWQVWRRRDP